MKVSKKAARNVQRETHIHNSGYLKYTNNDWKGKRAGRHDEQRNVDILCLQETKWKWSKARNIGGGCKLFYNGADGRKTGIGIVVREELVSMANIYLFRKRNLYNLHSDNFNLICVRLLNVVFFHLMYVVLLT